VGGFYGDGFCSGIDFLDGAGDDVSQILSACAGDREAGREKHQDGPDLKTKNIGAHISSLERRRAGSPLPIIGNYKTRKKRFWNRSGTRDVAVYSDTLSTAS